MGLLDLFTGGGSAPGGAGLLNSLFDQIMPGPPQNPYGGLLSDDQYQQYRRQQFGRNISSTGDFLMRAAGGNYSGGQQASGDGLLEYMKLENQRRKNQQARGQTAARQALTAGNRYDPDKGILWDTPPQARTVPAEPVPGNPHLGATRVIPPNEPRGLLDFEREGLLGQAYPGPYGTAMVKRELGTPKAPKTVGGMQWNQATGRFDEIPGYTQQQSAIAKAKSVERGGTATLNGRMRWILATGKDPQTGKTYTPEQQTAFQRALAPGSNAATPEQFIRDYVLAGVRSMTPGPEAYQEAQELVPLIFGGQSLPQGRNLSLNPMGRAEAAEQPGVFDRARGLFGLGGETNNSLIPRRKPSLAGVSLPLPPETGPATPRPVRGQRSREIDSPTRPIPRDASGKVNAKRLMAGQTYEAADGTRWRWNGRNFTEAL